MPADPTTPFMFGIHPFAVAGMATTVARGAPDDFTRLPGIINELRGNQPLLLRIYIPFTGDASIPTALSLMQMVTASKSPWEAILMFRFDGEEMTGWLELIREAVMRFGHALHSLQITSEANLLGLPESGDGCRPHVLHALREGIILAKSTARKIGAPLSIGFSAVSTFKENETFWPAVGRFGEAFASSVDYVGLDLYPDVFGPPIPAEHLPAAVTALLSQFRHRDLSAGRLPSSVPIRITENGWPTGLDRTYERQAIALDAIIRAIHAARIDLNITHYELFALRDADSANDISFYQFGILRHDYTPKPAFKIFQQLIQELSATA